MSIGPDSQFSASDSKTEPPYNRTQVALSDWPDDVKKAWQVFDSVNKGDTVIWGDRSQALVVQGVSTTENGHKNVEVEGPRGGSYTLRERYDDNGYPRFYADDSRAMDLDYVEGATKDTRPFTEEMYERVVQNLKRAAINNYVEKDYDTYNGAVGDVVSSWIQDVEFQRWSGWPYEWEDDDSTYIYRMVREHSGELPELGGNEGTGRTSPKNQARVILEGEVTRRGREMAHEKLIQDEEDYRATVLKLADDAVDRADVKAQMDAREATVSIVEEFIEAHTDPVWRSILRFSNKEPDDIGLYEGLDQEDITREMALDILDEDVWERAREIHEERGTHDPTVRGIAFYEYDDLAEALVEDTLREHQINGNRLLHTTANEVVREFADNVEDHEWPYDFGGVNPDTWGAGDVEDIFSSIVLHAEVDPVLFNPFARDKERKMATQVLTEVVHRRASDALDEGQRRATKPVPADEYLKENFGDDISFEDIRGGMDLEPVGFIRSAISNMDGTDNLAGWTFVDELVEEAGATVPYISGPWVLADYGLVMADNRERSLAWFNQDTGAVLTLTGMTDGTPQDGEYGYEDFHVHLVRWEGPDEPNYLVSDANLDYAFTFVREFIDADTSDVNVIETADGAHYIQESIEEDDINARPFASGIAPSFNLPGPGFTVEDTITYGKNAFESLGKWLTDNSRLGHAVTTTAVGLFLANSSYLMYRIAPGLNVQPDFDKKYGVGVTATYEFGQESEELDTYRPEDASRDDQFFTGKIDGSVRITPGAFRFLADSVTPDMLYRTGPNVENTVLEQWRKKVEKPLRQNTGDLARAPRIAFLGAHIPTDARGRPATANDYDEPTTINIRGFSKGDVQYSLPTEGAAHGDSKVRSLLARLAVHGYMVEENGGYRWGGDQDLRRAMGVDEATDDAVEQDWAQALTPAEVQELGWSLRQKYFFDGMFGDAEEVAPNLMQNIPNELPEGREPVCTHRAFLKIWTDLPSTPNTTVLGQMWKFYKARSEDEEGMTLLDAYNRYRMTVVYSAVERETVLQTRDHLREASRDGSLRGMFDRPTDREYWWNPKEDLLSGNEVFAHPPTDEINAIGDWLIFPAENERDWENRPAQSVTHYFYDKSVGGSGSDQNGYKRYNAATGEVDEYDGGAYNTDGKQPYRLSNFQDIYNAILRSEQSKIAEEVDDAIGGIVTDPEEWEPGDSEEDRKWLEADEAERIRKAAAGTVDWSDLDGTDMSVLGLFLRGVDMETTANLADKWNLSDRFQTRLSDVLPNNLNPTRPDIPSFEEWVDTRRGRNAIGSASDKARAKARYFREIAGTANDAIPTRDALGWSPGVEDDAKRMRDAQEHLEETDYQNFEQFYGNEFGEAFDDVAHKFVEQQPQRDPSDLDYVDALDEDFEASETERGEADE